MSGKLKLLFSKLKTINTKDNNKIISIGGGAFLNKELRKIIKQKSSTFWLYWNADTLIKRLKNNDKRPIIKNMNNAEIKKLISERNKIYNFSEYKIILNFNKLY